MWITKSSYIRQRSDYDIQWKLITLLCKTCAVLCTSAPLVCVLIGSIMVQDQGRNRHIFLRGQSHFSWFFSRREMLFPGRKFPILVDPKQISVVFKSEKQKKRSSPIFITFPTCISNFPPSLLQFTFFSSKFSTLFPFFLDSFFPIRQEKFSGQKSLGGTLPPCPPPVTPLFKTGNVWFSTLGISIET